MTMEEKLIVKEIINKLMENECWFTTKNDPTYEEAPSYYKLDQYGDLTEDAQKIIVEEVSDLIGDGAVDIEDAIDMWFNEAMNSYKIAYRDYLVTNFENKPVVDNIEAYEVKLEESVKTKLKEENDKSLNLISAKFTDPDFDSDSKEGQIVMRTSELFNVLTDKGYTVQVSFDNGESQSVIPMGQQGGSINITINNTNQPLRAFTSGNFEITDENVDMLNDIKEQLSAL